MAIAAIIIPDIRIVTTIRDMATLTTRTPIMNQATGTRRTITSRAMIRTRTRSTIPTAIIVITARAMVADMAGMDTKTRTLSNGTISAHILA